MLVLIPAVLGLFVAGPAPAARVPLPPQGAEDVPVTIKEIDVAGAIREFQEFQRRLGRFREEIGEGRAFAKETAERLRQLREAATPENDFNEAPILEAVSGYVGGIVKKQVKLVDFLESQRYRIAYYANKMASSVRPEDMALFFGTEDQAEQAIRLRVREQERSQLQLADFVDALPDAQIDRETFRRMRAMPRETSRQLDLLLYRYQQEKNALDLAKKRLRVVRSADRVGGSASAQDVDSDLLVGQMFGALDRIRMQMSLDLMYLEQLLGGYSHSTRTHEVLEAFQNLIALQGDLEGPSPELAGILDWLQDSSTRRLSLSVAGLEHPGLNVPSFPDLLREAYQGARGISE